MTKTRAKQSGTDKTRFELRFDTDVYEGLKKIADQAQISLNQLMQGIGRWALENAHVGEPHQEDIDCVETIEQPGCVWFGEDKCEGVDDPLHPEGGYVIPAKVVFSLDFTERHVVRDDWKDQRRADQ